MNEPKPFEPRKLRKAVFGNPKVERDFWNKELATFNHMVKVLTRFLEERSKIPFQANPTNDQLRDLLEIYENGISAIRERIRYIDFLIKKLKL